MAVKLLEYKDYDFLLEAIANDQDFDFSSLYTSPTAYLDKLNIEKWSDLGDLSFSEGSLFEKEKKNIAVLVNYQNLNLNSKTINFLAEISTDKEHLYLFSRQKPKFLAEEKKLLKKAKIDILAAGKFNPKTAELLAQNRIQKLGLNILDNHLQKIIKPNQNYTELLNLLDYLSLIDKPLAEIERLTKPPSAPIFVQSFSLHKIEEETKKWAKLITENELQLGLSLILNKLIKQKTPQSRQILKKLIRTDKKIKTRTKVDPLVWWKLFLWEASRTN